MRKANLEESVNLDRGESVDQFGVANLVTIVTVKSAKD